LYSIFNYPQSCTLEIKFDTVIPETLSHHRPEGYSKLAITS
jgi:hypothetical protein